MLRNISGTVRFHGSTQSNDSGGILYESTGPFGMTTPKRVLSAATSIDVSPIYGYEYLTFDLNQSKYNISNDIRPYNVSLLPLICN